MQYVEGVRGNPVRVTKEIDIFSLGCCIFFALTGDHLFKADKADGDMQLNSGNPKYRPNYLLLQGMSQKWRIPLAENLIRKMTNINPLQRPDAQQVLDHPFFWSYQQITDFFDAVHDYLQSNKTSPLFAIFEVGKNFFDKNWKVELGRDNDETMTMKAAKMNVDSANALLHYMRNRVSIEKFNFIDDFYTKITVQLHHKLETCEEETRKIQGSVPEDYINFWLDHFPRLLSATLDTVKHLTETMCPVGAVKKCCCLLCLKKIDY